uniref:CHY-type domain-containing protein n=1 Tax=Leersia perrieri TaxID=77586 RepID=A0A0D9VPI0_9ORYZ
METDLAIEQYGCEHYRRKCKIRAPCCGEIFDCRHCHNQVKDSLEVSISDRHEVPRHEIKLVGVLVSLSWLIFPAYHYHHYFIGYFAAFDANCRVGHDDIGSLRCTIFLEMIDFAASSSILNSESLILYACFVVLCDCTFI